LLLRSEGVKGIETFESDVENVDTMWNGVEYLSHYGRPME